MAALRGEADMLSQNYASYVSDPGDLGDGALNIVIQIGLERDRVYKRAADARVNG